MDENNMQPAKKKPEKSAAGMFIPAGIFIGMGVGFWMDQLVGGMFIGMGVGFLLAAITMLVKK